MSDVQTKYDWINRVLGVSQMEPTPSPTSKQVRFAPVPNEIKPPPSGGVTIGSGRARANAITVPPPALAIGKFESEAGKTITIARSPKGGVLFTAPPPPVGEITFSGGGAKGSALPGAIQALEESGVLKGAKKIAGASVGSMTAALVAAGITAEEFTRVANSDAATARITEGSGGSKLGLLAAAMKNKATTGAGNPLTGQGLENIVRDVLDDTLRTRIVEYLKGSRKNGAAPDPTVVTAAKRLGQSKGGPTFDDLRVLSKVIPAVKEVVITGTYTTEFDDDDKGRLEKMKGGNDTGQLYVFDADSEPDLAVAVAVHASASFPVAFKPVDIKLSSGLTVRFIDGGVMNNTPTSSSIGNERKLDPVPASRGMTFIFEDEDGVSKELVKGMVKPGQGFGAKFKDWITGSNHCGAEYAKDRDLSDRPEEIVVVPLTVTLPPKKPGGKATKIDMRGGTLNFGLSDDAKLALQSKTKSATEQQIEREKAPKTREFASDAQMFVSIPIADLQTLADGGYKGAKEALVFRGRVAEMVAKLRDAVKREYAKDDSRIERVFDDKDAKMAFDELDTLAGGDAEFEGYIGRELNKGGLDTLLDALRKRGGKGGVIAATLAVNDALRCRTWSDNVLKELIYPKMKVEREGGAAIETLLIVEGLLRAAQTPGDVNEALTIAIDHFKNKSDRSIPKRGHKAFAAQLRRRLMRST